MLAETCMLFAFSNKRWHRCVEVEIQYCEINLNRILLGNYEIDFPQNN